MIYNTSEHNGLHFWSKDSYGKDNIPIQSAQVLKSESIEETNFYTDIRIEVYKTKEKYSNDYIYKDIKLQDTNKLIKKDELERILVDLTRSIDRRNRLFIEIRVGLINETVITKKELVEFNILDDDNRVVSIRKNLIKSRNGSGKRNYSNSRKRYKVDISNNRILDDGWYQEYVEWWKKQATTLELWQAEDETGVQVI